MEVVSLTALNPPVAGPLPPWPGAPFGSPPDSPAAPVRVSGAPQCEQ
jgi:hypothetical protein